MEEKKLSRAEFSKKMCEEFYDSKPFFNLVGNLRTAKNGQTYYNGVSSLDLTATNLQTLFQLMREAEQLIRS